MTPHRAEILATVILGIVANVAAGVLVFELLLWIRDELQRMIS